MRFDPQAVFADLAEREKIKGHHSPEGRAIRTLSRALNGWSSGNLSAVDVLVLCDQAMEDWLKARLKMPAWSARSLPELLTRAAEKKLIARVEAARLQRIHRARARARGTGIALTARDVESALELCIRIVEKQW
jgi:hypothetical protein